MEGTNKENEALYDNQSPQDGEKSGPAYIAPDDVNRGPNAPPSFEEVMGQNQTSIIFTEPELPPLAYIDIMPRAIDPGNIRYKKPPVFETFGAIINGANLWLQQHPGLLCWKCETVERKVKSGTTVDLSSTSHHASGEGFNCHVMGLRIWFVRKMDNSPIQQLGHMNFVPEGNLSELVAQLNNSLKSTPVPGTILNVETATVKYTIGYGGFDPEGTSYCELGHGGVSMRKSKQILRLFFVKGPARPETLYMHEILPRQVRFSGSKSSSKFETSDGVVMQAQEWLRTQSNIRVVNIETRDVQAVDANMKISIFTDKMDDFLSDSDCMYVKILRIFFVNTPEATTYATTTLTSRLFTPTKLGSKGFEPMIQLMNRIVGWLQITQLPIFSVETVDFPAAPNPQGCRPERVDYGLVKGGGKRWVTAIRLYFPVPFNDPAPPVVHQTSGACVLL